MATENEPLIPDSALTENALSESQLLEQEKSSRARHESLPWVVHSIRLSRWYLAYCLAVVGLSGWLIYNLVGQQSKTQLPIHVILIDGILTFGICLETGADMILKKQAFWFSWIRIFDVFVSAFCLFGFFSILFEFNGIIEEVDEVLGVSMLTIRCAIQAFRVVRYARSSYTASSQLNAVETETIIFPDHNKSSTNLLPRDRQPASPTSNTGGSSGVLSSRETNSIV